MSAAGRKLLGLRLGENDADAETLREYLGALLHTLWEEGEGFSGKRPWGNSDWQWRVYEAMVREKAVEGKLDDEGDIVEFDEEEANKLVLDAIDEFGREPAREKTLLEEVAEAVARIRVDYGTAPVRLEFAADVWEALRRQVPAADEAGRPGISPGLSSFLGGVPCVLDPASRAPGEWGPVFRCDPRKP